MHCYSRSFVITWNKIAIQRGTLYVLATWPHDGLGVVPVKRLRTKKGILQGQREYLWFDIPNDATFSGQIIQGKLL